MPSIGLGCYPAATLLDVARAIASPGIVTLCMGEPTNERHDFARSLRGLGCLVIRRHFEPDNAQIDWSETAAVNAGRWHALILGRLTPAQFTAIYAGAVGPNELASNSRADLFPYLAAFELALTRLLKADGIPYYWGSVAVGNIDPIPFATTFAAVNAEAAGVCAHVYAAPSATTLDPHANLYYARRPLAWFQECQRRSVPFRGLLAGESGTYLPWTQMGMSGTAYVALQKQIAGMLDEWRGLGMPVVGQCVFAMGAEGQMGASWNLGTGDLDAIGQFNKGVQPMPPTPPSPTYSVGAGVLALMAQHGDRPKSDEHYVLDATGQTFKSETFGTKGVYQWNKQANETVFFPFG